ncbi:hypothetical protein NDS46_23455 [Paenibacillus thiaminolyticus]|uniref:hypothetical protein n=1 Tax=Paenibacillus thiaminolyticus TaxID=49283 RepID=UPI00232E71C6|nr:hypothetical protein [Paenibacillus thiaminolyticus]WCF07259.1 hypothetical protein NDS46_23455 [Paenibacillus thiaminolyticus]
MVKSKIEMPMVFIMQGMPNSNCKIFGNIDPPNKYIAKTGMGIEIEFVLRNDKINSDCPVY